MTKLPKGNSKWHLVEQPSLKVLNTFDGYTVEATRQLANAQFCLKTDGIEYFGLYTTDELEAMRKRRDELAAERSELSEQDLATVNLHFH